jgi:hypothetical protein
MLVRLNTEIAVAKTDDARTAIKTIAKTFLPDISRIVLQFAI